MTTTATAATAASTCESCGHNGPVLVVVPFPDGERFEVCPACAPPSSPPSASSLLELAVLVRS